MEPRPTTETLDNHTCKLSFIRHGQSMYNKRRFEGGLAEGYDYRDDTNELSEKGREQAQQIVEKIEEATKNTDTLFYISLLSRAVQTIEPYLEKTYGLKLTSHPVYLETKQRFDQAMKNNTFRRQDFTNIEVEKNIYLDARVMERRIDTSKVDHVPIINTCTGLRTELTERAENFLQEMKQHAGKQIIISSHRNYILRYKRHFNGIHYLLDRDPTKTEIKIRNGELHTFYLDTR